MTHYGRYETVEELYRGPLGHVALAHLIGDDEADEFVTKVFDPALMGLLEADAATQTFLDRAGLQKLLADRGALHWAPIYEMKAIPEGAYYVTDFYPLTAQKLLDAKVDVTSGDLHWLVGSIVSGLQELKSARKRAHANLKPGNILIASRQKLNGADIFLIDPASGGKNPEDRISDMRAVGKLIHQLVLGQPWNGEQDWPISDGPQWSKLGREAKGWRDLCRQLLDPSARPEDVDALAAAVQTLVPRPPAKRRHLLALAAVPVVALAAFLGVLAHSNYIASEKLKTVDHDWFSKFARAMEDPARRSRYRADPDLKTIVDALEQAEARHVPLNSDPPEGLRLTGAEQSREIYKEIKQIEVDLSSGHWKRLADALALKDTFAQRRWDQPAEYLDALLRDTQATEGADVAAGVDRFLRVQPRLASDAEAAEALWKPFDADLQTAGRTNEKTLTLFAQSLRRSAVAQIHLDDNGLTGLDELKSDAPLAARLAEVSRNNWPADYGRERLAREVESHLNMIEPAPADVKRWAESVSGYQLRKLDESSQAVATLMESFAKARVEIGRQSLAGVERGAADHAEAEVESRIKTLKETRYLSRDILANSGDLAVNCDAVRRDIEALRKEWVKLDDPAQWLAFVEQPLPLTSDRLKQRWKQWVESQRSRAAALAGDHAAFIAAKAGADSVRAALTTLDQKFPQVPLGMSERFAALAWDRREQALSELSGWAAPVAPMTVPTTAPDGPVVAGLPLPPIDLGIDEPAKKYAEWAANLHELSGDFPITRELLTLDDRPDQKWKAKAPDFWNDPAVQTLVRVDISRLANLQAVADATREQLVGMATTSTSTEIALAAWRRLGLSADDRAPGISPVSPAWPTQKGELDTELAIRGRLDSMLKSLKNAGEAATPVAQLKEQGPIRWRRFTETCDPELIPASAHLFRSFGVDEAQVNKLSFNAHFDFFLYMANLAAAGSRDEQVTAAVDNLRTSAQNLKDRPEIADLIVRLDHLGDRDPMNDPKLLEQKPGDAYRLSIKDSPYSIQFVRVQAPGIRPFYLATTETSIGMFMDTVSAANAWPGVNGLLKSRTPARGPKAWSLAANPAQPIVRYNTWRFGDGENPAQEFDFAPSLWQTKFNRHTLSSGLGGNPQEEHPMQQLPAQAAMYVAGLLNCRLPTVREWRNAYDLFEAKTDIRQWNLRDQTFKMQLDYHAPAGTTQWPDNQVLGAYWPKDRLRPGQANCRDTSDGTLFFRKVDALGGSTFFNLVGNVAEFVCNAPDAFAGMADRRSPEAVARFAASMVKSDTASAAAKDAGQGKLFVIGASSLSDPELDPVKPYPVSNASEPFADVGFRLAFSAPVATLAERLKWAIDDQAYLPPVHQATTNASAR